jgi:phosphoadenosine phosphosulfate reductase
MLADVFARHEKVALLYSGGKDSLACLYLAKEYLDRAYVVWVDTQANFPEIEEAMLALHLPNMIRVVSDQPTSIKANGYPVDVVPVDYTKRGQEYSNSSKQLLLRNYMECCTENIWFPARDAIKELGVTAVIRGQRADESHGAPITSGHVEDGVEHVLPLENWTQQEVLDYLQSEGVDVSGRLGMAHSSLDCWDCTAYCNNSQERMAYIKANHPEKHAKVVALLKQIDNAVTEQMSGLRALLLEKNHGL